MQHAVREVARAAPEGALVIVTMPNPLKGEYRDLVLQHRRTMRAFGMTKEETGRLWNIVDGPTKGDTAQILYNRYTPPETIMRRNLEQSGLAIQEVRHRLITTGRGNKEIYYVCKRVSDDALSWEQKAMLRLP